MKKTLILSAAIVAMAMIPFTGLAQESEPTEKTLKGEPVDMVCYIAGRSGPGHASCARTCAEKGNPIGLVVSDGDDSELYLVLGASGKQAKDLMAEHMGQQVSVTGKVQEKDGMKVLTAESVSEA